MRDSHVDGKSSQQTNQFTAENLFEKLLDKGINLPELVVHTILPEAEEKKKKYEEGETVKKKTIAIPMKPLPEEDEPSSPLLRKRRTNTNAQFSLGIKKISKTEEAIDQDGSSKNELSEDTNP